MIAKLPFKKLLQNCYWYYLYMSYCLPYGSFSGMQQRNELFKNTVNTPKKSVELNKNRK